MVTEVVREIIEESERRASRLPEEDAEPVDSRESHRFREAGAEAGSRRLRKSLLAEDPEGIFKSGVDNLRFAEGLSGGGVSIIAEVKPSSPTRDFPAMDPAEAARAMERGGASAISVLTEPTQFGGSMENLLAVRDAVDLPVLRKDFVIDERQLHETARAGADAVLLIARFLQDLDRFVETSIDLGIEPLVEVHSAEELERGLDTEVEVVGVNSRDLETLEVDLSVAEELLPRVDRVAVAESGIRSERDLMRVKDAGADAALIGTAIVEGGAVEAAARRFVEASS
ncbi:MAG: Indole-3-glycerol phosphate synthase [Methanonatronarchaeales archaeon]|nr:Indole-3-glycerol phosphate synthase [Methanonatronarchaeales archaeon]